MITRNFFSEIFISKMVLKINFRIITKNFSAQAEIRFLTKSILKPFGRTTVMPTAWELKMIILNFLRVKREKVVRSF